MSNYSFTNILEYIPKKYVGLSNKQLQDRQAVYDFKDGHCPENVKQQLLDKVRSITCGNPSAWVVCFIPASTREKHMRRYGSLTCYLKANLDCDVCIDGIDVAYDRESGHLTGKTGNPTDNMAFSPSSFLGKKVILIDDVRTRGVTFTKTADKMISLGAADVYGVFIAQTIHPNLPIDTTQRSRGGWYDDVMNDIIADEIYQDEIQAEMMADLMYEEEMQAEMMAEFMYDNPDFY